MANRASIVRRTNALFARASVTAGLLPGALVVPPPALQRDAATGKAVLYVVADGKAQRREVVIEFKRTFMVYRRGAPEVTDTFPATDEEWTV